VEDFQNICHGNDRYYIIFNCVSYLENLVMIFSVDRSFNMVYEFVLFLVVLQSFVSVLVPI
jgi:hypothetical protein